MNEEEISPQFTILDVIRRENQDNQMHKQTRIDIKLFELRLNEH